MIIVPKYRDLIVPVKARSSARGFFKIEARDEHTGKTRVLADWFPNLLTTLGADLLGSTTPFSTCAVGSGNTAPTIADTALQSLVGSTTSINSGFPQYSAQSGSPYYGSTTFQYNFPAGTAAGNLAEVGVGSTATSLLSRALILDGGGSPTTITVLSSESLYVTYQFNHYVPTTDITGTIVIGGTSYGYTLRASNATQANDWAVVNGDKGGLYSAYVTNGALGAVTSAPSGSQSFSSGIANNSYSNGSHLMSGTATWDLTHGNLAGGVTCANAVFGISSGSRGSYQIQFGAAIPKDSSHVLTLEFSSGWTINSP